MLSGAIYGNPFATTLSGGVGGARMARALATAVAGSELAVIVNVADDDRMYGVHVAADLDTVLYTLAGIQGPEGWGIAGDTFRVMDELSAIGADTRFRLGDRDLAHCLRRTMLLETGTPLSACVTELAAALDVDVRVLPVTDDPVRTRVGTADGDWLGFQDYFVLRRHEPEVTALDYTGAEAARPAPGVLDAIACASIVIIAPSNPPLSTWPILAVPGIREALAARERVVAVSPLFGGKPLKGPADRVMAGLGLPEGNAGVLAAYEGVITDLVVDVEDARDALRLAGPVAIHAADTHLTDPDGAKRFAAWLLDTIA